MKKKSGREYNERPRSVDVSQEQIGEDEEIFDASETDSKKITKLTPVKIVKAIITFGEVLSGYKFYKYEKDYSERIVNSLVWDDGETITGLFCRQSGKSFTSGVTVPSLEIMLPLLAQYLKEKNVTEHRLMPMYKFEHGLWTGVYGPDYERAGIIGNRINNTLSSDRAKSILSEPEIGMTFPKKLSSYMNMLPRGSIINVKSANKKVSIEGDTYHLVITDETQEISDYVLKKSISPFLASTNGTTVHNGSTYPKKVYFYDICQLNKKKDLDRTKKKKCHFEYNYKIAEKYNPNYRKYIQKEKEKLGEYSDEFRMSYELYWPIEKGMFITEEFLAGHLGRDVSISSYDMYNDHVISIDVGKILDSTVLTVIEPDWDSPILVDPKQKTFRYRKKIKNWYEIQGDNYDAQYYQILDFLDNYKWSVLIIDATGVGAGLYDRFAALYADNDKKRIIPFVFSTESKSDGYVLLGRELLAERITYPNSDQAKTFGKQQKFVYQITNLYKEMRGAFLNVIPVDEEGHDDYCDSLMMNVWAIEEGLSAYGIEDFGTSNIYKRDVMQENLALKGTNKKYAELLNKYGFPIKTGSAIKRENDFDKSILHSER